MTDSEHPGEDWDDDVLADWETDFDQRHVPSDIPPPASPFFRYSVVPPDGRSPIETTPAKGLTLDDEGSFPPHHDRGAHAALRTFRPSESVKAKPRFLGSSSSTARTELLAALAAGADRSTAATLHVAAAEIDATLGRPAAAADNYRKARDLDPTHVLALRALGTIASEAKQWPELAALLRTESELPVTPAQRSLALMALAELQLTELADPDAALRNSRTAQELHANPLAFLLEAQALTRLGRETEGAHALEGAASHWHEPEAATVFLTEAAALLENTDQVAEAEQLFRRALEWTPAALDARLGLARCALALDKADVAANALLEGARALHPSPLAASLTRAAARVLHLRAGNPERAAALLAEADPDDRHAQRARLSATMAGGTGDDASEALDALTECAAGTDRPWVALLSAELAAAAGDSSSANRYLTLARADDAWRPTADALRQDLSIRFSLPSLRDPDGSDRNHQENLKGLFAKLARLALHRTELEAERTLLADHLPFSSPLLTELRIDTALEDGDDDGAERVLREIAEKAPPERRLGTHLILADRARSRGETERSNHWLELAAEGVFGSTAARNTLARRVTDSDPARAAELILKEQDRVHGPLLAHLSVRAGRLLRRAGEDPLQAFRLAADEVPSFGPALWELAGLLRAESGWSALADLHRRAATVALEDDQAAHHRILSALAEARTETHARVEDLLSQAHDRFPDDCVLADLRLIYASNLPPQEHAELLLTSVGDAPPPWKRALELRAAAFCMVGGDMQRAAEIYREYAKGSDSIANRGLDLVEVAMGESSRVATRRFRAIRRAKASGPRIAALEALHDFDLFIQKDASAAIVSMASILETFPAHLPALRALEAQRMETGQLDELLRIETALLPVLTDRRDAASHGRLAMRLLLRQHPGNDRMLEDLCKILIERADLDDYLCRQFLRVGRRKGLDHVRTRGYEGLASRAAMALEQSSYLVQAALLEKGHGHLETAERLLTEALAVCATHPTAAEHLGVARAERGHPANAAGPLEEAARSSAHPARATALWYRAGELWMDHTDESERAIAAFQEVARLDPTYLNTHPRLYSLLERKGDLR
ncbi:MAG: hypothetical protein KC416_04315, partial [Myxococcales bacterium]|nr:hypothetical protein [Myxococcales bacterium]